MSEQQQPASQAYQLPSGRVVRLALPDLWAIVSQVGRIPNPIVMAVLDLLIRDGAYTPEQAQADLYLRKREEVLGVYAAAALCMVEPRLAIGREPGEGEIGPRDLPYGDAEVIYYRFFRSGGIGIPVVEWDADPADAAGAQSPAPAGLDVPPPAEPVPAHH
jgi:hypothetical protein